MATSQDELPASNGVASGCIFGGKKIVSILRGVGDVIRNLNSVSKAEVTCLTNRD